MEKPDYNDLMRRLEIYMEKYDISFQFWGHNNNNVFVDRHDIDVYSTGQHETPAHAIEDVLVWLDRVNTKPKKEK